MHMTWEYVGIQINDGNGKQAYRSIVNMLSSFREFGINIIKAIDNPLA